MSDLISRQAAIKAIEDLQDCYNGFSDTYDKACIIGVIEEVPTIKAEPIKHGRWSEKHYCSNLTGYDYAVICSECEKPTYRQFAEPTPDYCSNCGAKMDLDEAKE